MWREMDKKQRINMRIWTMKNECGLKIREEGNSEEEQ